MSGRTARDQRELDPVARVGAFAASQLHLAVRESEAPVEALGGALERIALTAAEIGRQARSEAESARLLELQREIARCAEALQYHDRMVQHICAVRDFLAAAQSGFGDDRAWARMHTELRKRLHSDASQQVFDMLLNGVLGPTPSRGGEIDLF